MTDFDAGLIMGSFFIGMTLWFVKAFIHFDYLKQKGQFKDVESLTYLILRPFYAFAYLPELFVICNIPILWGFKGNKLRFQIGVLSYSAISCWVFTLIIIILTGN